MDVFYLEMEQDVEKLTDELEEEVRNLRTRIEGISAKVWGYLM